MLVCDTQLNEPSDVAAQHLSVHRILQTSPQYSQNASYRSRRRDMFTASRSPVMHFPSQSRLQPSLQPFACQPGCAAVMFPYAVEACSGLWPPSWGCRPRAANGAPGTADDRNRQPPLSPKGRSSHKLKRKNRYGKNRFSCWRHRNGGKWHSPSPPE